MVINYKSDSQAAREVLNLCNAHSTGNIAIQADISNELAVKKMMERIGETHASLHVLVNNAGTFDDHDHPTNVKIFEKIFKNNFLGHIIVIKHALKLMKRGKIVNVSSIHGKLGYGRPTAAAYASFKAALENYTKNLAKQLAPSILVNAVAPGRVATPMWGNPNLRRQKKLGEVHLIKRMIQPEEVANAITFLVKNDAMCGEILSIDGGYRLGYIS